MLGRRNGTEPVARITASASTTVGSPPSPVTSIVLGAVSRPAPYTTSTFRRLALPSTWPTSLVDHALLARAQRRDVDLGG